MEEREKHSTAIRFFLSFNKNKESEVISKTILFEGFYKIRTYIYLIRPGPTYILHRISCVVNICLKNGAGQRNAINQRIF